MVYGVNCGKQPQHGGLHTTTLSNCRHQPYKNYEHGDKPDPSCRTVADFRNPHLAGTLTQRPLRPPKIGSLNCAYPSQLPSKIERNAISKLVVHRYMVPN